VFEIASPQVEEVSFGWLTIRELTVCNATRKAWSAAQSFPDAVVLGADTLVTIDDRVLGKPVDLDDAARILRLLSGRSHEVWTAAQIFPGAVVLGADTLVTIDDRVLGKPVDLDDAARILRLLSGRSHEVWTAVCLCHLARGKSHSFCAVSRVKFRELTDHDIQDYFAKVNPLDKAGAYAAQGHGEEIIQRIDGSYTNVVGLPMELTARQLGAYGITAR